MRSVENAECRKCGVWKMRSVKEKYVKSLKEKKGNIATRRYNTQSADGLLTQYNSFLSHAPCADPGKAQYS